MTARKQALNHFAAGEFGKARAAAVEALEDAPEDVELLRLAGRAGVESGADDAVEQLRKAAELQPGAAESWRDLGDALAAEGRTDEAADAFRKVLEIEPEDETALTAIGHSAFESGDRNEAVSMLAQVAGRVGGASTAAISLVEMYRTLGEPEEALASARKVAEADPENPLALLDVAELALLTGNTQEAAERFARLREVVDVPDEEVGALHGMIRAELARGDAQRALELAREAGAIDVVGRSPAVLAHLEADLEAESSLEDAVARGRSGTYFAATQAPPTRAEAEQLLDATLADLRRGLTGVARG
jgi:tetratricopeptide (TPR) repeat protein